MRATQRAQFAARPAEIVLSMCHENNRNLDATADFGSRGRHLLEKTVQPGIIGAPNCLQLHPTREPLPRVASRWAQHTES